MSWNPAPDPGCPTGAAVDAIMTVIVPQAPTSAGSRCAGPCPRRGRVHQRDSLGTDRWIEPGAVSWMVAGRGITQSERTDGAVRAAPMGLFGIQTRVVLPAGDADRAPVTVALGDVPCRMPCSPPLPRSRCPATTGIAAPVSSRPHRGCRGNLRWKPSMRAGQ